MRAARFHHHGGPEVLRVEEVPTPEPGPGEVRIDVRAAALNHLDLWIRRGLPIETTMPTAAAMSRSHTLSPTATASAAVSPPRARCQRFAAPLEVPRGIRW